MVVLNCITFSKHDLTPILKQYCYVIFICSCYVFQSKHLVPNATMEKVVYAKKKSQRTFGVPLAELVRQAPQGYKVPFIVKKICSYIEHHGEYGTKQYTDGKTIYRWKNRKIYRYKVKRIDRGRVIE